MRICLEENGIGKTPVAVILAFMLARYWISQDEAEVDTEVRLVPDLDFLRGDPGTKHTPFIFDDGDMSEIEPRKMKAFLDVAETPKGSLPLPGRDAQGRGGLEGAHRQRGLRIPLRQPENRGGRPHEGDDDRQSLPAAGES